MMYEAVCTPKPAKQKLLTASTPKNRPESTRRLVVSRDDPALNATIGISVAATHTPPPIVHSHTLLSPSATEYSAYANSAATNVVIIAYKTLNFIGLEVCRDFGRCHCHHAQYLRNLFHRFPSRHTRKPG